MEYFDILNRNGEFTEKIGPWNFLKRYYSNCISNNQII